MKLHKELTSIEQPVYDRDKSEDLFDSGKISYRKLSLMKQENIRVALGNPKITLEVICNALGKYCGYCFKFSRNGRCIGCLIYKKQGKHQCSGIIGHIGNSKDKKKFAEKHREWCEKIGLWKKEWR